MHSTYYLQVCLWQSLLAHFYLCNYLFQYFTFCVLLVMIMCAVYQILISLAKLVILSCICTGYLALIAFHVGWVSVLACVLLILQGLWVPHQQFCVCRNRSEVLWYRYLTVVVLFSFVVALIIHSQHTEATYRLDFLWKLQATGKMNQIVVIVLW